MSGFPNLVTPRGLCLIDAEIEQHRAAHAGALAVGDNREAAARAACELRYWTARGNGSQVQPAPEGSEVVSFGAAVTILREDGRRSSFRIVGEDEANPAQGLLSWASPLGRAMMDKGVGEIVEAGAAEAKIVTISG